MFSMYIACTNTAYCCQLSSKHWNDSENMQGTQVVDNFLVIKKIVAYSLLASIVFVQARSNAVIGPVLSSSPRGTPALFGTDAGS